MTAQLTNIVRLTTRRLITRHHPRGRACAVVATVGGRRVGAGPDLGHLARAARHAALPGGDPGGEAAVDRVCGKVVSKLISNGFAGSLLPMLRESHYL